MTQTNTAAATYRKTKTGEWVVFAPAAALAAGNTITVTKKDGDTKTETIATVGKSFEVNGVTMAYGYIAKTAARTVCNSAPRASRRCRDCGGQVQTWSDGAADGYCHDCV
jgi:hypothetical protein